MTHLTLISPAKDRNAEANHSEFSIPQAPYSIVQDLSEADRILRAAQPMRQQGQPRQPMELPQKKLDEERGNRQPQLPTDPPDPTKREEKLTKQL